MEQRPIGAPRTRFGIRPDDKTRIEGALRNLRDMPRDVIINRDEIIHFVHKQAAAIQAVTDRLEVLQPEPVRPRRAKIDPKSAADAVFAKTTARRDQARDIITVKGRRVRVLERGASRQLGLPF